MKISKTSAFFILVFSPCLSHALSLTTFVAGSPISASSMNSNFSSISSAISGLPWATNGSVVSYTGGYVGIGTTSASTNLYIKNSSANPFLLTLDGVTASTNTGMQINSGIGYVSFINFLLNGSGVNIQQDTGNRLSTSGDWRAAGCLMVGGGTVVSGSCVSDRRIKKNIKHFTLGLKELRNLQPVLYQYNGLADFSADDFHVGFVAQDVEKGASDLVGIQKKYGFDDLRVVHMDQIPYVVINALRELDRHVQVLEKRLKLLENLSNR